VAPANQEASVVLLILAGFNLADVLETARGSNTPVWINAGLIGSDEVAGLRAAGLDLTTILHWIDPFDRADIDDMVSTMRQHHPRRMIVVEWPDPAS
jgi:hypothetical protein